MADGANEAGNLRLGRALGEIVPRDIGAPGNDEDVDRRLRIDVVKGERMLVLIDLPALYLAAQDAGEDVGLVIWQSGVDRHADLLAPLAYAAGRGRRNALDPLCHRVTSRVMSEQPPDSLI